MVSYKIIWNSIISMLNAKLGGVYMKNLYPKTPPN